MDRKLTEDEKYCIRLAYYLGKQHQYDEFMDSINSENRTKLKQ